MENNTPNTSGVYTIINAINGKRYVGSTVNLRQRLWEHKHNLERGLHRNAHLQNAWNKYGADNFNFLVLFCCPVEQILILEQQAIDKKAEYNISPKAGNCLGVKHTPEMRAKLSIVKTGKHPNEETRKRMAAAQMGRHHSDETKAKISAANRGVKKSPELCAAMSFARKGEKGVFFGKHHTEETKAKIAEANKGHGRPIGYKHTPETKQKISVALKGKAKSPEFCALMREARKGEKCCMWGTYASDETKARMSAARKAWWERRKAVNE